MLHKIHSHGRWDAWRNKDDGPFKGNPTITVQGNGTAGVFVVRKDDHQLYHVVWGRGVLKTERIRGCFDTAPPVLERIAEKQYVDALDGGRESGYLYRASQAGFWEPTDGFEMVKGNFSSAPSLVSLDGFESHRLVLFGATRDKLLWRFFNGAYWVPDGKFFDEIADLSTVKDAMASGLAAQELR